MKTILIAGASGFIGMALIQRILEQTSYQIIALSRQNRASDNPRVQWKKCDLYSLKDIIEAGVGCDEALYLVHSMLPTSGLSQGKFYDFDLILADNFARAAKQNQLKHIIYLGGMIPKTQSLSWHLRSRLEVETTLKNSGIKFTGLRAGLIIGQNGSSFVILQRLVARLPIMVCPSWTKTQTQPVALHDIINVLLRSLIDETVQGKTYDVGGKEILTYQDLISITGRAMGRPRSLYTLPLIPLRLSRLWVSVITSTPRDLVYPLVLSLRHTMIVDRARAWPQTEDVQSQLFETLKLALEKSDAPRFIAPKNETAIKSSSIKDVRSVQRMSLPKGKSAEWVMEEYFRWLPRRFRFFVHVNVRGNRCTFYFISRRFPVLILDKNPERSTPDRPLLYVTGGLLSAVQERGRMEFREVLNGQFIIAALHEFRPSLPWTIYKFTQARVHQSVMKSFAKHLERC